MMDIADASQEAVNVLSTTRQPISAATLPSMYSTDHIRDRLNIPIYYAAVNIHHKKKHWKEAMTDACTRAC